MSNDTRGEVTFDLPALDDGPTKRYRLKFNNAGRKALESEAGMSQPEIDFALATGKVGPTLLSAMLWGATRMFHSRQVRSTALVDTIMDQAEEVEAMEDLSLSLIAAYSRRTKAEIREEIEKVQTGDEIPDDEDEGEEYDDQGRVIDTPLNEETPPDEGPKDPPPGKEKKPKDSGPLTEAGRAS